MKWGKLRLGVRWIGTALVVSSGLVCAQAVDLDGHAANPFTADSGKSVVLVFLRRDCPVSGGYAPSIQQISKRYADRAAFWLVYPDKSDTPQEIRKSVAEYGYHLPVLRDPDHALVKLRHAQITPEVAVFDRHHQLIYDGRIDSAADRRRGRVASHAALAPGTAGVEIRRRTSTYGRRD